MGSRRKQAEGVKDTGNNSTLKASIRAKVLILVDGEKEKGKLLDEGGSRTAEYGEENGSTRWISDDTLMVVMSFFSTRHLLSRLAFVCRRWRRLSKGMVCNSGGPPARVCLCVLLFKDLRISRFV